MDEFFDFSLWCVQQFVSFLFDLPFLDGISFGSALVAITVLAVLIVALVGTIRVANLSGEAHAFNRRE